MSAFALAALLLLLGCGNSGAPAGVTVLSVKEVGTVPDPPGCGGRDVGFSARFGGHSTWIFGDTFFADASADGYHWRSNTWSYTDETDASTGLGGWVHGLGADGKPLQLVPQTADEQAFDDAHNGSPCPAGSDCGARHTPWLQDFVVDPATGTALVFYTKEYTEPTGSFAFTGEGTSIATWASPSAPAVRPAVQPGASDPTLLFTVDEPPWGAAALVANTTLYAYACPGGSLSNPCRVARVPMDHALDRASWEFWNGSAWVSDWHSAVSVFDGAPLMTVHFSEHLNKFLAIYLVPLRTDMALRTADHPEGPWSAEQRFGTAAPALDGSWDYALASHHEFAIDGGRVEYLSYFQPGKFLDGVVHLVEVTLQ
jgi:hypothetical protein